MRHWAMRCAFIVAWGAVGGPVAFAQQEESYVVDSIDARSISEDWLVLPAGSSTLTGQLRFLTAEEGLGVGRLRFTDVVLLDISGRRSLGGRADIYGGFTLLPKQPSRTGELIWQRGTLGGRIGFAERFAAALTAQVGPLLRHGGQWATADLSLEVRKTLDRTFYVQGSLRGSGTMLFFKDGLGGRQGFGEIVVDGMAIFREPSGTVAGWIGTEFRFPFLASSSVEGAAPILDPQTRVNFRLGGTLSYIKNWDIFTELAVSDRGDASEPATQLPVLEGGFDQTTVLIGITRRFGG